MFFLSGFHTSKEEVVFVQNFVCHIEAMKQMEALLRVSIGDHE